MDNQHESMSAKNCIVILIGPKGSSFLLSKDLAITEEVTLFLLQVIKPIYNCTLVVDRLSVVFVKQSQQVFYLLRYYNSNPSLPMVESKHYGSGVQGLQSLVCYYTHFILVS